jgi:TonB family protein
MVLAQEIWRSASNDRMPYFKVDMILTLCAILLGALTTAQVGSRTPTSGHALGNTDVPVTSRAGLNREVAVVKMRSSASNFDGSPTKLKKVKITNSPGAERLRTMQEPTSASQNNGPGVTKATPDTRSKRIQNIAPEEIWNRVTECFFPQYPRLAIDTHITGAVNIGLLVTPRGDIGDNFRVLDGPPLLVQPAIDAIRQWKFQPNEVQGGVTWSRVRAVVRFNSDGTTTVDLAPAILADNFGNPGTPKSVATTFPQPSSSPACKLAKEAVPKFVDGAYVPLIGGIGSPKCMECPDASYSEEARAAKVSGTVVLHFIVTEEGQATNIQVKRSLGHGLDEKAVEAVRNWRFKPAVGPEDKPVPVWIDVEVNFRIK